MQTLACPDCDLLQTLPPLPPGGKATCPRCGCTVAARSRDPIERPLALTVAALVALVLANTTPLMDLSAVGRHASTTILGGAYQMWLDGEQATALVVAFCAAIAPTAYVVFTLTVLLAARRPPVPHWVGTMLGWANSMRSWAMVEVMMLGILVALVKIADLATVNAGVGMYAVGALVALFPAIAIAFEPEEIWRRIEWAHGRQPSRSAGPAPPDAFEADSRS